MASFALASFGTARAQLGVVDQISPTPGSAQTANFAVSNPTHVWQQQVRAGVAGTLTAVEVELTGPASARVLMRVRPSAGWSNAAPVFQAWLQKTAVGAQKKIVDVTSAQLQLAIGDPFVIELVGDGSLAGVNGSYTSTAQGAPEFVEPLFLAGPTCYGNCGWRIGLRTWVTGGDVTEFCFGVTCPCGNSATGGGCANSTGAGAKLYRSAGTTSTQGDDLELAVHSLPSGAPTLLFLGASQVRAPFADGLRCAGGGMRRLQMSFADAGGVASFTRPVSRSAGLVQSGAAWNLQAWYRDPISVCGTGSGLSSAVHVVFGP